MLPSPVRRDLRSSVDEAAVARMWRRIRDQRRVRNTTWLAMLGWGAIGACIAVLAFGVVRIGTPETHSVLNAQVPASVSRSTELHLGIADVARDGEPMIWLLPDGSRLTFQPDTRWEPLSVSPTDLISSLRRGSTLFEVKPGGPRRWVIQAGPVSIEVIGTVFTVERDEKRVAIAVERGAVLVRGEPVPDKVQKLIAGQRIEVSLVDERRANDEESKPSASAETPGAREPQRLLALADGARLSGHPADAVPPLERLIKEHPERPEAALAAVTLGRIFLDQLGRPRDAARAFERALALGAPQGLRGDVQARLVEAYERAGDAVAAEHARQGQP